MAASTSGILHPSKRGNAVSGIRYATIGLVVLAFALHTYTAVALASEFHAGFWLWSLSPYFVVGGLFWTWRRERATLGAAMLPAIADLLVHYGVFVAPEGSTAAVGLVAAPLWNLFLLLPLGAVLGWLADRRADQCEPEQAHS